MSYLKIVLHYTCLKGSIIVDLEYNTKMKRILVIIIVKQILLHERNKHKRDIFQVIK